MTQAALLLFVTLLTLVPGVASAYIPPSEFIVKGVTQKRSALKSLRLRGVVLGVGSDGALTGARFTEETLYDGLSGTIRSYALDEQNAELYRMERVINRDGSARDSAQLVSSVLFETRAPLMVAQLRRWELPVKTEDELLSLADEAERRAAEKSFFGRQKLAGGLQVSWVLGEKSGNQLWIEKDTFLPSRILLSSGAKVDVQLESYRVSREVPLPRLITVSEGREPVLREEIQELTVNPTELADPRRGSALGFTEAGESADGDVRDLIRKYYKLVR
jgi:hypothetical protein